MLQLLSSPHQDFAQWMRADRNARFRYLITTIPTLPPHPHVVFMHCLPMRFYQPGGETRAYEVQPEKQATGSWPITAFHSHCLSQGF